MEQLIYAEKAKEIRRTILTTLHRANGSFSGGALSSADIIAVLFHRFMRFRPETPNAPDRDMFILSKGHCSSALYAGLVSVGMIPPETLACYGANGSTLCIHPKRDSYPGWTSVQALWATGSLWGRGVLWRPVFWAMMRGSSS